MDNVVVTGGTRGVGLAVARRLARSGYRILAVARKSNEKFEACAREARAEGGEFVLHPFDFEQIDQIARLVTEMRDMHGPIYGLVNNAAVSYEGVLATLPNSQIETLLRVNTLAPIVLTKYVARGMMSSGRGRIVNVSSIVASTGYRALTVYSATKASMIGFTKSLAREVGELGVTVNAVAPGFLETELTRKLGDKARARIASRSALRRLAKVDDVAEAVNYLMGPAACNVTGTIMTIDAGSTA